MSKPIVPKTYADFSTIVGANWGSVLYQDLRHEYRLMYNTADFCYASVIIKVPDEQSDTTANGDRTVVNHNLTADQIQAHKDAKNDFEVNRMAIAIMVLAF